MPCFRDSCPGFFFTDVGHRADQWRVFHPAKVKYQSLLDGSGKISFTVPTDIDPFGEVLVNGNWGISSVSITDASSAADALLQEFPQASSYIFRWLTLEKQLLIDEEKPKSAGAKKKGKKGKKVVHFGSG